MSKAPKKKKSPQARKPRGAARRHPGARIDSGLAALARDNVLAIVGQGRGVAQALEIAFSAGFLADHLIRRFEADHDLPHPIACGEGCDFCCHNRVELTPPEALRLGHYMAGNFSAGEIEAVLAAAARNLAFTRGKSPAAVAAHRRELPCPLLQARRCSVYPVRPLVCRAVHGLDRRRCETELRSGSLAGSRYYAHRHDIALSVSTGLREGCQSAGLQSETLNLTQALIDFFSQASPVERWISGEAVFTT